MSHEETGFKSAGVYVGQKLSTLTAHCSKDSEGGKPPAEGTRPRAERKTNEFANNHDTGCVSRLTKRLSHFVVWVS